MEFFRDAMRALPIIASSPYAFVGYIVAVIAWLIIAFRVQRNKNLLRFIESLPEKDRLGVLTNEMQGVAIKGGLTPQQYLKSNIHFYYLLAFGILCLTFVIIFVVAVARPHEDDKRKVSIHGKVYQGPGTDHRLGIEKASVYLEIKGPPDTALTTRTGDFVFQVSQSDMGKTANVWADAESYTPSKEEAIILKETDGVNNKVYIPLAPKVAPSIAPTLAVSPTRAPTASPKVVRPPITPRPHYSTPTPTPLASVPVSKEATKFHFTYQFGENPGEHIWTKINQNTWTERYPKGEFANIRRLGR